MRMVRKVKQFFVDIPIEEGAVINDRYRVLHVIGAGSYGIVYLVKDLELELNKVVKQLRPSKRRNSKEVNLFNDELAVLSKLDHNRMPRLYEVFTTGGNYFYTMSFITGDNLEDLIFARHKIFQEKEALLFIEKLLVLVDYLHSRSIFHLDLRIPNMILKDEELFLIDFGLARQENTNTLPDSHHLLKLKQQDYYDVGDVLLYLLYTSYSSKKKKALPWTEELSLRKETVHLLKRLLRINEPYSDISDISVDLRTALEANENEMD
ncbi:serine/threonine protein kinase [Virgibacillus sp. JSM 102003]|uniref:serine/threonine protein kinase n=1 Tax=Virgibacillus sp. JSM 102003 TaxID=1562108 RepID=UPI0035C0D670